ncbi:MAG: inositol monophosphatase family protein [Rickettsiella sp.]|nr:inositol monophosphatase family protein [Rickettsiella sp.]
MPPLLNIADAAARSAGKIILDGLKRLDFIRSKQKENRSIVTEIDLQAEKAIINKIQESYPYHAILAEERGAIDGKDYTWLIDPLDGTSNFIHDFPHFSVSIAIKNQAKNYIEHALVFDPLRQETFTATRGKGAYLNNTQRFSRRLRVSNRTKIEESLLGICIPSRRLNALAPPLNKEALRTMMAQASGVRRTGSAVLDLAYVAAGRLDAALELNLEPWDMATGILLIREAGGIVCDLQGKENYFETGHIIGANPKLCPLLLNTIQLKA